METAEPGQFHLYTYSHKLLVTVNTAQVALALAFGV